MRNGKYKVHWNNVRIGKPTHEKVVSHCVNAGITFGAFYERAAIEKIEREKENEKLLTELKNQKN